MTRYGGAPDECGYCYIWAATIVQLDDVGNCPANHGTFGPGGHFGGAA